MGQAPPGASYNDSGKGVGLIAGAGDFKDGVVSPAKFTSAPRHLTEPGDIVLSIRASIGAKVWADGAYCLGRGVAGLRAGSDIAAGYLWHAVSHLEPTLRAKGRGATFLQVNRRDIEELVLPLPEMGEQKRIAAILDRVDAQRSRRRVQLEMLNTLASSAWLDAGSRSGGSIWALGDLARWRSGNFLASDERNGGSVPVYGANGVIGYTDKAMVTAPEIIVGRVGACGAVRVTNGPSWITDNALIASFDESVISRMALTAALRQADLGQYAVRSSQPSISGKRIAHVPILVPSLEAQREFTAVVEKIDVQRARVERALALEDELYAALQHRAFRGEL